MSVPQALYSVLGPLVGNRVYPSAFPQSPSLPDWPAIRYSLSRSLVNSLCADDTEAVDDVAAQIDIVATTYPALTALKAQVVAALANTDPPCARTGDFETYDTPTKTHRAVLSYVFQLSSITP